MKFLLAHPHKHHAFSLAAGIASSGAHVQLRTPIYSQGLTQLISLLPVSYCKRLAGYKNSGIPRGSVHASQFGFVRKFISRNDIAGFERSFDDEVCGHLERQRVLPDVLVTLQDYLPKTVKFAYKHGIAIWSDQILNNSLPAAIRVAQLAGATAVSAHDEKANIAILQKSKLVTVPSKYCLEGVREYCGTGSVLEVCPYGVDFDKFFIRRPMLDLQRGRPVRVLARANSIRKGGKVLAKALEKFGLFLPINFEFTLLGGVTEELRSDFSKLALPSNVIVNFRTVPHNEVAQMMSGMDIFLLPTFSEGMSLAAVEAMAAGLVVLTTPYCGVDALDDSLLPRLFLPSVEGLLQAFDELLNSRHLWSEMSKYSQHLASQMTWKDYEGRIRQIANKVEAAF